VTKPPGVHRDVLVAEDRNEIRALAHSYSVHSDARGLLSGYLLESLDALSAAERERDERDRTIAALMRGLKMLSQQVQTAEEERIRILLEALFWSEPWPTPLVSTVLRAMGETP
jgi:uncharacterized protein involved in type VI secretion and phage assembly